MHSWLIKVVNGCYKWPIAPILKNGEYELVLKRVRKTRSNQQMRYLWGVIYKLMATETGHTADEVHEAMKCLYLSKVIEVNTLKGSLALATTRSLSGSGDVDTSEMTDYIEQVRAFAAMELGLSIPDPI